MMEHLLHLLEVLCMATPAGVAFLACVAFWGLAFNLLKGLIT
jgi:hypothetical protein